MNIAKRTARPAVAPYRSRTQVFGGHGLVIVLLAMTLLGVACRQDMYNQPKAKPLSQSEFFKDGMNARPLPPNTIAQGGSRDETAFFTGLTHGNYVTQLPMKLTSELMTRGRERYDVYCAVCHGATGAGNGMIVQRGYPPPPSYHIDRLRQAPIGHFYDVITSGYGVMYSYAARVTPGDRWAIAAYIRALQLSRNAKPTDLAPNEPLTLNLQP